MTIFELGALGEFVGAITVIATLVRKPKSRCRSRVKSAKARNRSWRTASIKKEIAVSTSRPKSPVNSKPFVETVVHIDGRRRDVDMLRHRWRHVRDQQCREHGQQHTTNHGTLRFRLALRAAASIIVAVLSTNLALCSRKEQRLYDSC